VQVKVAADNGVALSGVTVTFAGTGTFAASATTDADGIASTTWKPDSLSSNQTLTASVHALSMQFNATVTTSLAGSWIGSGSGFSATMNITHRLQAPSTSVIDGPSTLSLSGSPLQGTVTGSSAGPTAGVIFHIRNPQFLEIVFSGTIEARDTRIVGTLNGMGLNQIPFTMVKQP
jgi:hypothetical protein